MSTVPPRLTVIVTPGRTPENTRACLDALGAEPDPESREVLLVTDQPAAELPDWLGSRHDVRVLSDPTADGPLTRINLGAGRASTDIIAVISGDVRAQPGLPAALLQTFDERPDAGLVGAVLLDSGGGVLNAGDIVFADGTTARYGAGQSPDEPVLRSVRDVDGPPRQCYAVRRRLFESIGGLSGEFWPGAGAHLDLAFGVRAQGFRTLVQPLARVSELPRPEGAADPGPDQRFAPADAAALRRRWADTLQTHGSNTGADALWQGSNRRPRGMVLVCDNDVPTPDRDSGSRRMDGIIRILSDLGYAVYLAPGTLRALEPYTGQIGQRGVTVLASEHAQFTFIREAGPRLRAVLLSRPAVAHRYLEHLYTHAPDAIRMFDTVDLHALRLWREFGVNRRPETLARARYTWAMERAAIELCDVTFVVSGVERSLLARELPQATVRVLSNIHLPVVDHPDPLGRNGMMFVGNFEHPPNADAIDWFAQEILPLIREQEPDATLTVVGSHLPESVAEWETAGVEIAGWVPDIAPMYRAARVVVAPLRYGAGVKGKVAEAVEHGVPVVGTPIALEGMGFELGLDVEAADDPRRFADAVIRLLRDDARWRAMAGRGQAVLTRVFAPWVARSVLVEVLTGDRARDESPFAGWPTSGGVNDPSTDRPSPGAVAG